MKAKSKKKSAKPVKKSASSKKKLTAKKAAKPIAKKKSTPAMKLAEKKKKAKKPVLRPVAKISPRVLKEDLRTRYNDRELEEFRLIIAEKLDAARHELRYLQEQISRSGDNGTDDTENKFASMEDGSSTMEREYLSQMAARQKLYIDHLDKAAIRIKNKTYGICRVTGKLIDKERLRAVPHATLSMEAKMKQHSNLNIQ